MNISIIQGVALSVMTVETVNFLKVADRELILPSLAQTALSLAALIIVSYEYLWFTTLMRWTPTFRDTAIPVALGVAEIVPPMLLGRTFAWWIALSVFAMLGAAAFLNTVSRLRAEMFPDHAPVYAAIRRLLCRLAVVCTLTSAAGVSVAILVHRNPGHAPVMSAASACVIILLSVVFIIAYSEAVLNKAYAEYGISRRPPLFDRLQDLLRRAQSRFTPTGEILQNGASAAADNIRPDVGIGSSAKATERPPESPFES
ncbi:hypothetical protein Pen02_83000 [Plantactinospora endophytica]|uniref:DUF1211 domain-containing protein n=2 Tax=Plantactinospora endophytica TaxID=673535 RepID=A0ABQ4EFD6_9ACTN|nr:hypothetical protein Pen02_83000 [Plantactinospora endophytica]